MDPTLLLLFVSALLVGSVFGILPGLNSWLPPLLLLPALAHIDILDILVFWTGVGIGSQFFGSISTILLGIPGESSGMIYVKDVQNLTLANRLGLIAHTARGSFLASIMAITMMTFLAFWADSWIAVSSHSLIRLLVYSTALVLLIYTMKPRWLSMILVMAGFVLAHKTNSDLPELLLRLNHVMVDVSIFAAIIGLIIIPSVIDSWYRTHDMSLHDTPKAGPWQWRAMMRGSLLGCVIGLMPGPSATLASMFAYRQCRDVTHGIIAAESANNSAIITSMMFFLLLGIPIHVDQASVNSLLQIKSVVMPDAMTLSVWTGLVISMLVATVCYFWAAQKLLRFWTALVVVLQRRLVIVYLGMIMGIVAVDLSWSSADWATYLMWLTMFACLGLYLRRWQVSAIPLIMSMVLADGLSWSLYQAVKIYG